MTWKQLVKLAKKEYGLKKLVWKSPYPYTGAAYSNEGKIILNRKTRGGSKNLNLRICTFFHELGHIHCYRNNLWMNFHFIHADAKKKKVDTSVRIALKAERWVDRWAAKEMKKYFPNIKYHWPYSDKQRIKDFKYEWRNRFD